MNEIRPVLAQVNIVVRDLLATVELFRTRLAGPVGTGHRFPFAVAKDGQRFLMYVTDPSAPPPGVTVIANWMGK